MVASISSGSSFHGVLAYNGIKLGSGKGEIISVNNMIVPGNDLSRLNIPVMQKSFELYTANASSRIKSPVFHVSLNPHPDDVLSKEKYIDIARDYMQGMGYGEQPYVVYFHRDIDRHHLHIVSVRIRLDGTKIDDRMEGKRISKPLVEELEKKYGLLPSELKQQQEPYIIKKVDYSSSDIKRQLTSVILTTLRKYKFQRISELNAHLNRLNVYCQECKGDHNGEPYRGLIYGVLDDKGNKVGKPIKASAFQAKCHLKSINRHIESSTKELGSNKSLLEELKKSITSSLNSSKSLDQFKHTLSLNNIDTVIRSNDEGRMYGITFIDEKSGIIINGSSLDRSLSINNIIKHFETQLSFENKDTELTQADIPIVSNQHNSFDTDEHYKISETDIPEWDIEIPPEYSFNTDSFTPRIKAAYGQQANSEDLRKKKKRKKSLH